MKNKPVCENCRYAKLPAHDGLAASGVLDCTYHGVNVRPNESCKHCSAASKYGNHKTTVNGIIFDSKKEADRYYELRLLERAEHITNLQRQVKYELIPSQRLSNGKTERAVYYVADFVYQRDGKTVVEDVKGMRTDVYKIKRKLMLQRYGIEIKET